MAVAPGPAACSRLLSARFPGRRAGKDGGDRLVAVPDGGRAAVERLSTLDAGFYFVEHQNVPMHIGSLAVFDGPAPTHDELVALYAAKLPLVRRYRQVVRTLPVPVFRPYWSDDQDFDLGYHLRHAAVPPPGGPEQLRQMSARIFAQRLDRDRPLWEAWFLEGIKGGRWAILSKVHHCMVDGIGGADLMAALFEVVARRGAAPARALGTPAGAIGRRGDRQRRGRHGQLAAAAAGQPAWLRAPPSADPRRDAPVRPRPDRERPPAGRPVGLVAEWPDRPAPAVDVDHGQPDPGQEDPPGAEGDGQRRGARRDHHRVP